MEKALTRCGARRSGTAASPRILSSRSNARFDGVVMGPVMIYGEVDKVTHLGGKIDATRIRDRKLIVDGGITERLQN